MFVFLAWLRHSNACQGAAAPPPRLPDRPLSRHYTPFSPMPPSLDIHVHTCRLFPVESMVSQAVET
jgi:hypothetical protein